MPYGVLNENMAAVSRIKNFPSYLMDDGGHGRPIGFNDVLATVDHPLVSFFDEKHFAPQVNAHANDGTYGGIHTCEYRNNSISNRT